MKLSIENYTVCSRFGEEKAFQLLKGAGFDACDYSFYYEREQLLGDDYLENARHTKAELEKAGLLCTQAHAPFEIAEGDAFDLSNGNYAHIAHSIEYAAVIGAEHIIVHLIPTQNPDDFYSYNQRYYRSLIPYSKKAGIRIAVENDFERRDGQIKGLLEDPVLLQQFIKDLDSDCFVACVDVGHAALFCEPECFIAGMDPSVLRALHIHDNDRKDDKHMFPCTGDIDWNRVCSSLKKIGYDGDFTLEVFKTIGKFENEVIEDALHMLAKVGRHLINKIEK